LKTFNECLFARTESYFPRSFLFSGSHAAELGGKISFHLYLDFFFDSRPYSPRRDDVSCLPIPILHPYRMSAHSFSTAPAAIDAAHVPELYWLRCGVYDAPRGVRHDDPLIWHALQSKLRAVGGGGAAELRFIRSQIGDAAIGESESLLDELQSVLEILCDLRRSEADRAAATNAAGAAGGPAASLRSSALHSTSCATSGGASGATRLTREALRSRIDGLLSDVWGDGCTSGGPRVSGSFDAAAAQDPSASRTTDAEAEHLRCARVAELALAGRASRAAVGDAAATGVLAREADDRDGAALKSASDWTDASRSTRASMVAAFVACGGRPMSAGARRAVANAAAAAAEADVRPPSSVGSSSRVSASGGCVDGRPTSSAPSAAPTLRPSTVDGGASWRSGGSGVRMGAFGRVGGASNAPANVNADAPAATAAFVPRPTTATTDSSRPSSRAGSSVVVSDVVTDAVQLRCDRIHEVRVAVRALVDDEVAALSADVEEIRGAIDDLLQWRAFKPPTSAELKQLEHDLRAAATMVATGADIASACGTPPTADQGASLSGADVLSLGSATPPPVASIGDSTRLLKTSPSKPLLPPMGGAAGGPVSSAGASVRPTSSRLRPLLARGPLIPPLQKQQQQQPCVAAPTIEVEEDIDTIDLREI
jgi:hypothetical protein